MNTHTYSPSAFEMLLSLDFGPNALATARDIKANKKKHNNNTTNLEVSETLLDLSEADFEADAAFAWISPAERAKYLTQLNPGYRERNQ